MRVDLLRGGTEGTKSGTRGGLVGLGGREAGGRMVSDGAGDGGSSSGVGGTWIGRDVGWRAGGR